MELVSSRNIEEMVLVLKKEVAKTHNVVEHEDTGKYRQLLVRTLHSCCIKVSFSLLVFKFICYAHNVTFCRVCV
jgi:Adaptin N terminal region.